MFQAQLIQQHRHMLAESIKRRLQVSSGQLFRANLK